MLKELKKQHDITYLTLDDGSADEHAREYATEYCQRIIVLSQRQREKFSAAFYAEAAANLLSPLPYAVKKYSSRAMAEQIERKAHPDHDVVVCDFLAPAVNIPRTLDCPKVLFEHNVEATIWRRHYEVQRDPIKKLYLWHQWQKMRAFEKETCRRFDCVVSVSPEDSAIIGRDYSVREVYDVPTGVDTDYFSPTEPKTEGLCNLVFTGSMDWLPNEDAIFFFAEKILPLIRKVLPETTLTVVGRNPSPDLCRLAKREESIIVTGRVSDVRPYIESAAVYVVPLRIGGGTRLKIYEAMAMGKAVVSTTVGAEGLPLKSGSEILLADSAADFADSVIRLLREPQIARKLGATAAEKARRQFGWAVAAHRFGEICEHALKTRRQSIQNLIG